MDSVYNFLLSLYKSNFNGVAAWDKQQNKVDKSRGSCEQFWITFVLHILSPKLSTKTVDNYAFIVQKRQFGPENLFLTGLPLLKNYFSHNNSWISPQRLYNVLLAIEEASSSVLVKT